MIKNILYVTASVVISIMALALVFLMMPLLASSYYEFAIGGRFQVFLINLGFTIIAPWMMLNKAKDMLVRGLMGATLYRVMSSGIEMNR